MLKKLAILIPALAVSAAAAELKLDFDNPAGNNFAKALKGAPAIAAPEAVPAEKGLFDWFHHKPAKKWTIMVYVNGKNNLEEYALKDMNEMELVGSTDKVNVVVELGRTGGYSGEDGDWTGVRRYLVKKDADTNSIASPVIKDLGASDMGDPKNLIAFGAWAKAAYPAEHYMLIVWNHGSGWEKNFQAGRPKGISYDEDTGSHISTPQLGEALRAMGGVDVYASDACLMQMAEVAYEIKDAAGYIVGSEETEPGDGYTYDAFLKPIAKNPSMTPADVARTAVDAYADHYAAAGQGTTQSYVNAALLPETLRLVDEWTAAVQLAGEKRLVNKALEKAQSFYYSDNKDLYDLVDIVTDGTKNDRLKLKGLTLMDHINSALVGANRPVGYDYAKAHGLAVYAPSSPAGSDYAELKWARDSGWTKFIDWYSQEK